MPIYEYTCEACGKPFELLIRRAADTAACPRCASGKVAKRFSTFGVSMGGAPPAGSPAPCFEGECGKPWCPPGGCKSRQ